MKKVFIILLIIMCRAIGMENLTEIFLDDNNTFLISVQQQNYTHAQKLITQTSQQTLQKALSIIEKQNESTKSQLSCNMTALHYSGIAFFTICSQRTKLIEKINRSIQEQ